MSLLLGKHSWVSNFSIYKIAGVETKLGYLRLIHLDGSRKIILHYLVCELSDNRLAFMGALLIFL